MRHPQSHFPHILIYCVAVILNVNIVLHIICRPAGVMGMMHVIMAIRERQVRTRYLLCGVMI